MVPGMDEYTVVHLPHIQMAAFTAAGAPLRTIQMPLRPDSHFHFEGVQKQLGLSSIALNSADGILVYAAEGGYSNVALPTNLPANATIKVFEPSGGNAAAPSVWDRMSSWTLPGGYTASHTTAQSAWAWEWGERCIGFCASRSVGAGLASVKKTC